MAIIDLEKCVTYGKLKAVRQTKSTTTSQTLDLTGNAEVSFEWTVYTRITSLPTIYLDVDNGTEIHLVNRSFASSIPLRIRMQGQDSYGYSMKAGGDGFESHAIVYANGSSLTTLQEWKAESDFWYGAYTRQEVGLSSTAAFRYRKIYLSHEVDYDATVTVYPGQEIWAYHSSANSRTINCIPATNYFESGVSTGQITLTPGFRALCMTTVNEIDWMFICPT